MTPDNPQERAARIAKAYKLADWLGRNGAGDPGYLEALRTMGDEWWEAVARHAGTRTPSPRTRELVIGVLTDRAAPPIDAGRVEFVGCDEVEVNA